jgi:hypothetical protein
VCPLFEALQPVRQEQHLCATGGSEGRGCAQLGKRAAWRLDQAEGHTLGGALEQGAPIWPVPTCRESAGGQDVGRLRHSGGFSGRQRPSTITRPSK